MEEDSSFTDKEFEEFNSNELTYFMHDNIRHTSSKFWYQEIYDDCSFCMYQKSLPIGNHTSLKIGPLRTSLSNLFSMGYYFEIQSWTFRRKHPLILKNNEKEIYILKYLTTKELTKYESFSELLGDEYNLDFKEYKEKKPDVLVRIIRKEVPVQKDPLDELMLRYPKYKKPINFIGNLTIEVYTKQQLKKQRDLHYG